jgi:3-hydroxyisobutyrate dehydrogenase-like beta-hydroxyacid dehydrogenase
VSRGAKRVGLLFPGEMGAAVAQAVRAEVVWASDGRSQATRERATAFTDVGSVSELAGASDAVISICPPAIAEDVAREVFAAGFDGIYVDANAISPTRVKRIAELGKHVVDGSIVASSGINLYLAGEEAATVAALFDDGDVKAIELDKEIGAASALKMAFGGWNKIGIALTAQAYAIARAYGVVAQLEAEGVSADRIPRMAGRAWRWVREMEEIADTCGELGLPAEIPRGAASLYRRWERHRDSPAELDELLEDLSASP